MLSFLPFVLFVLLFFLLIFYFWRLEVGGWTLDWADWQGIQLVSRVLCGVMTPFDFYIMF